MRGPELWKAGHNLVLSMHRAESFPNAVELAILGLETILSAQSVHLVTRRYSQDSLSSNEPGNQSPCPCHLDDHEGIMLERSIWPRENVCLIFCVRYEYPPSSDEELILDMVLEQLLCAGEHLPAEPDHDIDMSHLSRREREVLPLVAAANTNGQIASQLGISERTVEKHVASILEKTGMSNRKMIIAASPGRPALKHTRHRPTNFSNA
ncbi:MAG: helix-turn-helix transcriptional regulator [Verrucomicrobiota bacterium]